MKIFHICSGWLRKGLENCLDDNLCEWRERADCGTVLPGRGPVVQAPSPVSPRRSGFVGSDRPAEPEGEVGEQVGQDVRAVLDVHREHVHESSPHCLECCVLFLRRFRKHEEIFTGLGELSMFPGFR